MERFRLAQRGPTNLPYQPMPLIGRETELKEATQTILASDVRLLTLTGTGGTGKTRLGIEVAWGLVDRFRGGVFFVPMAPLTDHNLLPSAIMSVLGVAEQGNRALGETLKDYLREKQMLLFLDNFEHLTAAAPFVADLLADCPKLKILVTSREPLRIRGEHEFPLQPLSVPDLRKLEPIESLLGYPSITLFLQRAQAVRPKFAVGPNNARTVAEICVRLDGLPLALELAAARIRIMTADEILKRLQSRLIFLTKGPRDLPTRQQTLRNAIAWSYDLLEEEDKKLFRRLAIFRDGFTLEAVEAVCNSTHDISGDMLDGLSRLAEKSLILDEHEIGDVRFGILETLREFGSDVLTSAGELKDIQKSHVEYFLSFAEKAEKEMKGAGQALWLARLEREHDNLRAAMTLSINNEDVELCLRFASSLWLFWYYRGHWTEGRNWVTRVLAGSGTIENSSRANALQGAGMLAYLQEDFSKARALLLESLSLFRKLGDKAGTAFTLNRLAMHSTTTGNPSKSVEYLEESLSLMEEVGNRWGVGLVLNSFGVVARYSGEYDKAATLHQQALQIFQELGDKHFVARQLINLGMISRDKGDYDQARDLLNKSLSLCRELGEKPGIAGSLMCLGGLASKQGDHEGAYKLLGESLSLYMELDTKEGIVECLEEYAGCACERGEAARAARLLGACETLRKTTHLPLPPVYQGNQLRILDLARRALGEEGFNTELKKGSEMTIEDVIMYAVGRDSARSF